MTWQEMTVEQRHEAVLAAVAEGEGPKAFSGRLGLAVSTAQRWLSLARSGRALPGTSTRERGMGAPDAPPPEREWPLTSPTAVLFLESERQHCVYPLWDEDVAPVPPISQRLVCGDVRVPGRPYCAACLPRTLRARSTMTGAPFVLRPRTVRA